MMRILKIGILILCFFSCSKEDTESTIDRSKSKLPTIKTLAALNLTQNSATLGGRIIENGADEITEKGIYWGLGENPTVNDNKVVSTSADNEFLIEVIPLEPLTDYHYRAYAQNSKGIAYGENRTFRTSKKQSLIFEGNVQLRSQQEVDDFGRFGYTEITGNLRIINEDRANGTILDTDIKKLDALNSLTKVGKLIQIVNNDILTSIDGLANIESIGTILQIWENDGLVELNTFPKLTKIGDFASRSGSIEIGLNKNLRRIGGFHGLKENSGVIWIIGNDSLEQFDAFANLALLGGLRVASSTSLHTFSAFEKLETVDYLTFFNTTSIKKIEGFNGLERIFNLEIQGNKNLEMIEGFGNVTTIGSCLIDSNPGLNQLKGFPKLSTVERNLTIKSNIDLSSINAFNSLETIGWDLTFGGNTKMTDLNGFQNLISIGTSLRINFNDNLDDFCGLNTAIKSGISGNYLVIDNLFNPTLEDLINGNCSP